MPVFYKDEGRKHRKLYWGGICPSLLGLFKNVMSANPTIVQVQENEIPLKDLSGIMLRQRWLVLAIVGACLTLAGILIAVMEPVFQSNSRVILEGKTQGFPQGSPSYLDPIAPLAKIDDIPTQMEVMQSDRVIEDTLKDLSIPMPVNDPNVTPDPMIQVRQVGFTSSVEIQVLSKSKENAKLIAERIPIAFDNYMRQMSVEQLDRGINYLDSEITKIKKEIAEAEKALETFRIQNKVVGGEIDVNDKIQSNSFAKRDAAQAQADLESSKNYLKELLNVRAGVPDYLESVNTNSSTDEKVQIEAQIRAEQAQLEGLLATYTDGHPTVIQQRDKIKALKKALSAVPSTRSTTTKTRNPQAIIFDEEIGRARAKVDAAAAAFSSKQATLSTVEGDLNNFTTYSKDLSAMNRDLLDKVQKLGTLSKIKEESALRKSSSKSFMQLTGSATVPRQVKPNPSLYLILAALVGLLLAVPAAAIRDRQEDRITSTDQAVTIAGALPVGHIPMLRGAQTATGLVRIDPSIPRFENFRILRSNILFRMAEESLKTMLVTSTVGGEGKSDLAYNLAVAMAVDNRKVLLVDCNMRRPALHKKLRLDERPGLSEVLHKDDTIQNGMRAMEQDNLTVMVAGGAVESPSEVLAGPAMREFLESVKPHYDLIILDGAPMLPSSDAQILSSLVDGVLYVVQLNQTRSGQMRYATDLLRQARANVIGLVFNKMTGTTDGSAFKRY